MPRARGRTIAIVALLCVAGAVVRVLLARDALFADELSTYSIITGRGVGGVVAEVGTDAEITPPLSFVLSWLTAHLGQGPTWVRLPSLVAGVATIPAVYLLGRRAIDRRVAVVGALLVTVSPFMTYYAAEARGYAWLMLLTTVSTWALVGAVQERRRRWWVLYAVATCGAMYAHYTGVFLLAGQAAWVLLRHPEARRGVLVASTVAALGFVPWIPGALADIASPTQAILDALSPLGPRDVVVAVAHWGIGYPYATEPLRAVPGVVGLVPLALSVPLAALGAARLVARRRTAEPDAAGAPRSASLLPLVVVAGLSTPVGEAVASAVGSNLFGTRNLAAAWPPLALVLAAALVATGPRWRWPAVALVAVGLAASTVQMLDPVHRRPDVGSAARFVESQARPGDTIVDVTGVLSPGPATALDAATQTSLPIARAGAPEVRDRPFGFGDRAVPKREALGRAIARTGPGGRVFVVEQNFPLGAVKADDATIAAARRSGEPPGYRIVRQTSWPDFFDRVRVLVYAPDGTAPRGGITPAG